MYILVAVIILGIIIMAHEFGHFLIAKSRGIRIREFTIGFGPKLFGIQKGETLYSLRLLPLGGACVMGEDENLGSDDERAFSNKTVWERIAVIFAGPFFNFILAFVFALIVIGVVGYDPPVVLSINGQLPVSQQTSLTVGDRITKYNGKSIRIGRELNNETYFHPLDGSEITLAFERTNEDGTISVFEESFTPEYRKNYLLGFYYTTENLNAPATITQIMKDMPMDQAGLMEGDIIVGLNDIPISTVEDLLDYLTVHPITDATIKVQYQRGDTIYDSVIKPLLESEGYSLGFSYNYSYREKTNVFGVIKYSFYEVKYWIVSTVKGLFQMITGKIKSDEIGGPIRVVDEIGNVMEESKQDGALYVILNLLNWCVLLSANLGVMNLLPIPALDGGKLFFLFLEVIRRKPIPKEKEGMVHLIGIILLFLLMLLIFYNDIRNLFFP